jgi:apolipoprotein N-acyltransferase
MPKNHIIREFVRKFDEVQHEIDAHHWLLAVVLFILGLQLMTAWSLADLRSGLLAAAEGQQKINRDMSSLQQQVATLREAQRKSTTENASSREPREDAVASPESSAPGSGSPAGRPSGEQPKVKLRR